MDNSEMQIKPILDRYGAAVLAGDIDALAGLYADEVRVFDTWGVWLYDGAPAWRGALHQWLSSLGDETVRVSFDDVRVEGGHDLAVLSAIVTYAGFSATGAALRSMQNRITWALGRRDGDWRIVHEHTSAPAGFDDFKVILRR